MKGYTYGLHKNACDTIRIAVTRGSSVLEVSFAFLRALSRNTDTRPAVGNPVAELVDRGGLMLASHTLRIALSVDEYVLLVALGQLLTCILNRLHATLFSHLCSRDIGVQASAVPISFDRLGLDGDLSSEFLGNAVQEVASNPEMVSHWTIRSVMLFPMICF